MAHWRVRVAPLTALVEFESEVAALRSFGIRGIATAATPVAPMSFKSRLRLICHLRSLSCLSITSLLVALNILLLAGLEHSSFLFMPSMNQLRGSYTRESSCSMPVKPLDGRRWKYLLSTSTCPVSWLAESATMA